MDTGSWERVRSVRAELENLLAHAGLAEDFGRILRLALQERNKPFDDRGGFRWLFLPLWVCEALGTPWQRAVPVAAAVELLGAAGDVFDDLQDQDNKSSPLASFAPAEVMNAGLALLALAYDVLSREEALGLPGPRVAEMVRSLSGFAYGAAEGQYLDVRLDARQGVSEESYFRVVARKSGTPVQHACALGAQVASDNPECIQQFADYGRCLGIAFQIANDRAFLTDLQGDKSDVRARKLTLPVVYGLTCIPGPEGDILRGVYLGALPVTPEREKQVRELLLSQGAGFYARVQENMWRMRALEHLKATSSSGVAREHLEQLAMPSEEQAG